MATADDSILDFSLNVDTRPAVKAVDTFERKFKSAMMGVHSAAEKLSRKSRQIAQEEARSIEAVSKAYSEQKTKIKDLSSVIEELETQSENASGAERARVQEALKSLKEELQLRQDNISALKDTKSWAKRNEARRVGRGLDRKQGFVGKDQIKEIRENLKASGDSLVEPLRNFLARDAKGFIEASFKGVGKTFSQDTAKALMSGGALAKQRGAVLDIAGKRKGGLMGAAMRTSGRVQKAVGAGMGGAGKALGGIVKALEPLGKLIPIFGMLGGAVASLVKMFIDADSLVKEFNKGILESASNIEYMANYGSKGMDRLESDLESLGKAATDASFNNALGITKDQHTQIMNVLTQEGVSLGYLSKQAGKSNKSMGQLSQSIVASGVAYSRALGVPLQEINQLQASMITEMGASVQETEMSFAKLTRAAAESGIAGNKFFQMIKGVSQDLSVWNMRMEDSVDLLGRLTKVMSPRSAEKFFSEMSSGFRQIGRTDLLKQSMLAGAQATKEANQGTLARMQGELAKTLNVDIGKVQGKGYNEIYKLIQNSGVDQAQMGTLIQKLNEMVTVQQGMRGGTYGQAYATRHADTAGQLKILEGALERFGGTLENPTSLAIGAVADSLGKSPEFVEALANLARTAKAQKELMLEQATTPEDRKRIEGMSQDELINELGNKLLPKSDEEMKKQALSAAERQGQLTQDLTTKFSNFVDNFMVQFYYLVMDIYGVIKSLYKVAVDWLGGDDFDKGKRASGLEGQRLIEMLNTVTGTNRVGQAVSQQFSGDAFMKLLKTAGVSEEKQAQARKSLASGHGLKKAGDYDALKVLRDAGIDIKQVLGKALWERDDRDSSDRFVESLGIQKSAVPQMLASTKPEEHVGPSLTPSETEMVPIESEAKKTATTAEATQALAQTGQEQLRVLKERGININQSGAKTLGDEFLTAMRKALYEYYMYSGTDRSLVSRAFGPGGPNGASLSQLTSGASQLGPDSVLTKLAEAKPNANGGMVTGISNGMAVVAARGEGLASVGKGEQIVPAKGGGGVNISIPVSGIGAQDLARVIEGKVVEGIREYKRRERLY